MPAGCSSCAGPVTCCSWLREAPGEVEEKGAGASPVGTPVSCPRTMCNRDYDPPDPCTCGVQIRSQLEHRVLQIQEVRPNNQQAHKNCVLLTIQQNVQSAMEYPSISLHHKAAPKSTSTFLYDHTHTLQIPFPVCFINEGFACIWKPIQKWLSG